MSALPKTKPQGDAPAAAVDAVLTLSVIQDPTQRLDWLRQVRLFSDLRTQPGALERLAEVMTFGRYAPGAAILREGEEGSDAFFLCAGAIRVLKSIAGGESFPVAALAAKDHPFFGEAALLQSDKRSATILTETDCICLILNKAAFDRYCLEAPQWALPVVLRIGRVILDRLHKTNDDMILLYNALVREVKGDS